MPALPTPDDAKHTRDFAIELMRRAYDAVNPGVPVSLNDDQMIHCLVKAYTEAVNENGEIGEFEVYIIHELDELEYDSNSGS